MVDGDVEEVVVDLVVARGCGGGLLGAERRCQQEEQEEPSHIGTIAAYLWNGGLAFRQNTYRRFIANGVSVACEGGGGSAWAGGKA